MDTSILLAPQSDPNIITTSQKATFSETQQLPMTCSAIPTHPIPFIKMHGAGNDFVVIDARNMASNPMSSRLAQSIGHRRFGIGCDQLVIILSPDSNNNQDVSDIGNSRQQIDFALEFWNVDGSIAGACGNATRCVADYIMTQNNTYTLCIQTKRGILHARRERCGEKHIVSVNMGHPLHQAEDIPILCDPMNIPLDGNPTAVGMGNQHCVFFVQDVSQQDVAGRGAQVCEDVLFPAQTNVEFAQVISPHHIKMRVWERGAGITLACGSGTCATVVAAFLRGLTTRQVVVDVDGGQLSVDWRHDGVWLSGPCQVVFKSELSIDFLKQV